MASSKALGKKSAPRPRKSTLFGAKPVRQERAELTRRRLLQATLDCIAEHGYEGATMDFVVARAGVSRGAQMHHFPRKVTLVAEAMDYMLDTLIGDLRSRTESIRIEGQSPSHLLEHLWKTYFSAQLFQVTMELAVAARTDEELRSRLSTVADKFHRNLDDCWYLLCRSARYDEHRAIVAFNLTMSLLRGLGFQLVLWDRPDILRAQLNDWLAIMSEYIGREAS